MAKQKDLTGQRFTRWLVISKVEDIQRESYKESVWLCKCDCGTERKVRARLLLHIRSGSKSCGCLQKEASAEATSQAKFKHGCSKQNPNDFRYRLYTTWKTMRQRCNNPKNSKYPRYGARGISVCSHWNEFSNFELDMGPSWQPGLSIDRINNDGHYEPKNCRWATPQEQAANRGDAQLFVVDTFGYSELDLLDWENNGGIVKQLKEFHLDISNLEFYSMSGEDSAIFSLMKKE